jgi:hypothetical protein
MIDIYSRDYFDWQWWRFAYAASPWWNRLVFKDAEYRRLFSCIFWRVKRNKLTKPWRRRVRDE